MTIYPAPLVYRPCRWSLDVGAPAGEPVTLATFKAQHGRIDGNDEDAGTTAKLVAARRLVEDMTRRALVTQTRTLRIDRFPPLADQVIELPGGNIQSVTSITWQDADNATQTLASSGYATDFATGQTGRIGLAYGQEWPETLGHGLPVVITYVAGWPDDGASPADYGANVPDGLKVAIQMIASGLHEVRGDQTTAELHENRAVQALLSPWTVHRVG